VIGQIIQVVNLEFTLGVHSASYTGYLTTLYQLQGFFLSFSDLKG